MLDKYFFCLYYHKACHRLHYPERNTITDVIHSENEHILVRALTIVMVEDDLSLKIKKLLFWANPTAAVCSKNNLSRRALCQ